MTAPCPSDGSYDYQILPFRAALWAVCRFISSGVACACDKSIVGLRKSFFFRQPFQRKKKKLCPPIYISIYFGFYSFNYYLFYFYKFINFSFFIYFISRNLIWFVYSILSSFFWLFFFYFLNFFLQRLIFFLVWIPIFLITIFFQLFSWFILFFTIVPNYFLSFSYYTGFGMHCLDFKLFYDWKFYIVIFSYMSFYRVITVVQFKFIFFCPFINLFFKFIIWYFGYSFFFVKLY